MTNRPTLFAKTLVKRGLQRILPSNLPPIVVASMGRSGSTLVHSAIREAVARYRFPELLYDVGVRVVTDQAWNLDEKPLVPGCVYKTHGLAEELHQNCEAKVIFLFGSATDAALSVLACRDRYGPQWIQKHFEHLRACGPFEALGTHDVLRFADQLDGWIGKIGTQRLILHYDALWENEHTLSQFVGVPVKLPPRRARSGAKAADCATRSQFTKTYANLDTCIAAMPRCQELS